MTPSRPALLCYTLSPGGNTTLLVHDNTLVPKPDSCAAASTRAAMARELMERDKEIEQVGFINTSAYVVARSEKRVAASAHAFPHMVMMGGEFCVNACRGAALVFALNRLLPETARGADGTATAWEGLMTTSGVDAPLPVRVRLAEESRNEGAASPAATGGQASYDAAVSLPLPDGAAANMVSAIAPGETLVRLPGITHLLLDAGRFPLPGDAAVFAAAKRREHDLEDDEAVGVIWYKPDAEASATCSITPFVWVKATGSAVMETACGSGSLALAIFLAPGAGEDAPFTVRQPSGAVIRVFFETLVEGETTGPAVGTEPTSGAEAEKAPGPAPRRAWIDGPVRLVEEGMLSVDISNDTKKTGG